MTGMGYNINDCIKEYALGTIPKTEKLRRIFRSNYIREEVRPSNFYYEIALIVTTDFILHEAHTLSSLQARLQKYESDLTRPLELKSANSS